MKPAIPYYGGKTKMAKMILPYIPPHTSYVEVFGGSGAILFAKKQAQLEIYNDLDGQLVNMYRVLKDPVLFPEFERRVSLTLYSREEYITAQAAIKQPVSDPVQSAVYYYTAVRQAYGALLTRGTTWSYCKRPHASCANNWLSAIDRLPEIHERLQTVQIDNRSWERILDLYDSPDTCFYLDPPYTLDTRTGNAYRCETGDEPHDRLVDRLLQLQGSAVLSGYNTPIYDPLVAAEWQLIQWECTTTAFATPNEGQNPHRTECIWINPRARELLTAPSIMDGLL